jgi:hypothetical protein
MTLRALTDTFISSSILRARGRAYEEQYTEIGHHRLIRFERYQMQIPKHPLNLSRSRSVAMSYLAQVHIMWIFQYREHLP